MERLTAVEIEQVRDGVADSCDIRWQYAAKLLAEIDALTAERDEARRELALSQFRENTALRRGFDAGQAVAEDGNYKYQDWADFEKHLAEEEEHAATLARIAEAEEREDADAATRREIKEMLKKDE